MIGFLALILRLVLLAVFTFGFVVLFEHGPKNYLEHAKTDAVAGKKWLETRLGTGLTKPVIPPQPAPEPSPTPEPPPSPAPAAPSATPASTPASEPVATPASAPIASPTQTPMATPVPVTSPQPAPAPASPTPDEPTGAPSDWQKLQNQPIDNELPSSPSQ